MKLLVLNPNTTAALTDKVVAEVQRLAGPGVTVRGVTARFGHEVIASRQSFVVGAHAALELGLTESTGADAVLLACFGDPGLGALREALTVPVVGMAQASLQQAMAVGRPFHIITAGAAWEAMLRETVRLEQADAWFHGITVLPTTGLAVARDPEAFIALIQNALTSLEAHGAPTVILGGAGFAGLKSRLRYAGEVIDGLETAVRWLTEIPPFMKT
jgi:allantoin racemase